MKLKIYKKKMKSEKMEFYIFRNIKIYQQVKKHLNN